MKAAIIIAIALAAAGFSGGGIYLWQDGIHGEQEALLQGEIKVLNENKGDLEDEAASLISRAEDRDATIESLREVLTETADSLKQAEGETDFFKDRLEECDCICEEVYRGIVGERLPNGLIGKDIPDAHIVFTHEEGSIVVETDSDANGRYEITLPISGRYRTVVTHPSYETDAPPAGFTVASGCSSHVGNFFLKFAEY